MFAATGSTKAFSTRSGILSASGSNSARFFSTAKLNVEVLHGSAPSDVTKHVVFLHGLFGKGQSFQFIAKAKALQKHFTCHLVDMRNHGASEWHPTMDYKSLAEDVRAYLEGAGLSDKKVTLVGHSLGSKTAMAFACMFPKQVSRIVSLDASPVDRKEYPHLNDISEEMIKSAISLGCLKGLPLAEAVKMIKSVISDEVLQSALLFNLNADSSF